MDSKFKKLNICQKKYGCLVFFGLYFLVLLFIKWVYTLHNKELILKSPCSLPEMLHFLCLIVWSCKFKQGILYKNMFSFLIKKKFRHALKFLCDWWLIHFRLKYKNLMKFLVHQNNACLSIKQILHNNIIVSTAVYKDFSLLLYFC